MLSEAGNSRAGLQPDMQGSAGEGEQATVTARAPGGHALPGPQLAVTHASVCSEQEPAVSAAAFQRAELIWVLGGVAVWSALLGMALVLQGCQCCSSLPPFSSSPCLWEGSAVGVGLSLRDKPQGHLAQPHAVFGCPV